ncbi:MAG: pyridoxal phosphate-dependent aminotransferase [Pseudohongiellaceae bacterium]
MKTTRRTFVKTVGFGTALGVLSGASLLTTTARAQTRHARIAGLFDNGIIQLNQNESARGPGAKTLEAIREHTSKRVGRGYAPDYVNELRDAIAERFNLDTSQIMLSTGSTPHLQAGAHAFCTPDKPLLTAAPTFSTSEVAARARGVPIERIPLDADLRLDLNGMADAAQKSQPGLLYLCNPNNPTGTVHSPQAIETIVRRVMKESPNTRILIDEAYIDYADPSAMRTALPLALEFPNVFIARTFSKAHGMAGLRVGYAMGHTDTLQSLGAAWGMGDVNMLGAIAALTSFEDTEHMAWEREENTEIRNRVVGMFQELGFKVPDSQTNHIFPNLRRPAKEFRDACLEHKVAVGRDFPPLQDTHSRISLGSREEMEVAIRVFRSVLS